MEMRIKQIIENECLLLGLSYESISCGKVAAIRLYATTGCFSTAVLAGVKVAEERIGSCMSNNIR